MGWWYVALWVVSMVVSYVMRPKPINITPMPGEVTSPVVDSSSPVPVLFGTVLVKGANCVWYGDTATAPVTKCG